MTLLDKIRNRTARALQYRWRMQPYQSDSRHIIIGGSPGSGTTLFRRMLDRHPRIRSGPEFRLYLPGRIEFEPLASRSGIDAAELRSLVRASPSQGELIDRFAERYMADSGKSRWAEKTPLNVLYFEWALERFPDSRMIHVVRDGRDVVCSMADHPDWRWVRGTWQKQLNPQPPERYAAGWVRDTGAGMALRGDPHYHEVRYEDVVMDSEATLRRICDFLEEDFDEVLLRPEESDVAAVDGAAPDRAPVFDSSIGRWKRDLPETDQQVVMSVAGRRLAELGYVDDDT